jgi:hypothetical protein
MSSAVRRLLKTSNCYCDRSTSTVLDYLLIGGYALAAHGYQRATTDIDVVVPATSQAGQRVKEALMVLPDGAAKDIEPRWFEEGENIRVADAFVVHRARELTAAP